MLDRLLIAGASTRAAAESAARAGVEVIAVDAYADLDQHPSVRGVAATAADGRRVSAADLVRTAAAFECGAVTYLSPFENHLGEVAALARGRRLLGNGVAVLRRVRDPLEVARAFQQRGFQVPDVIVRSTQTSTPTGDVAEGDRTGRGISYLSKPLASGGGHGIVSAIRGQPFRRGWYLQEHVAGWPGSVTFIAARRRSLVLAVSRQLIGDAAFGASDYRYCGSLIAHRGDDDRLRTTAHALADAAADSFDLVGANGLDFVVRDGIPVPVEINPRWSSSMELVDRCSTSPVMAAHIEACHGSLVAIAPKADTPAVLGKAVVFAREAAIAPDTHSWLVDSNIRDIPAPFQTIGEGQPVCTVFAEGVTFEACYASLVARAANVYSLLDSPR